MSNEEYINDLKRRSAELEYEYWSLKVDMAKNEKETYEKVKLNILEMLKLEKIKIKG